MSNPIFIVIAGPNGAGKSTAASLLLPPDMPFLNADEIAKGLRGYSSNSADMEASRIVLNEMDEHENEYRGSLSRQLWQVDLSLLESSGSVSPVFSFDLRSPSFLTPTWLLPALPDEFDWAGIRFRRRQFVGDIGRGSQTSSNFPCR